MKPYLYGAIMLAIVAALSTSHYYAYSAGKQSIVAKLQSDRIEILKDGKRIDEEVLAADDDTLYCMLTECLPDNKKPK